MFCDRKMNNKINHIHEKALRIASKILGSKFETLLHIKKTVFPRQKPAFTNGEIFSIELDLNLSFVI